jgi:uncharacterized repeat protein (TIGR03806 family)
VGPFLDNVMPEYVPLVSGNWSAVVAFPNLVFTNAVGLAHVPGTNRLCVWEREGRAWTFNNASNTTQKTLVLDISNQCQGWDDSGLLGVAYHPGFETNRYLFVWYTWVPPGTVLGNPNQRPPTDTPNRDRLARFTLDANDVAIPGSELVLIDQDSETVWHNGGGMFFHPVNGFLYVTNGDDERGQNDQRINTSLHSGVLRIDVDQRGGSISHPIPRQPVNGTTANYYIPNDNPFVGLPGVLEEFFCLGLRSPHRMTHDPVSDRIFIGDVGQSSREEIDVIQQGQSGLNFQWNRIEGLGGDLMQPFIGINARPVLDYTHSEGAAVIGGYVYRGTEFASDLGGKYIFGDNVSRVVWVMDETSIPAAKTALCVLPKGSGPNSGSDYTGLSSFGVDQNGELYLCQMSSLGGRIYKLARSGPPPSSRPMPQLLSQTGAFSDLATLTPNPGLVPYTVNSPLWSDAAIKTRWLALPTNTFISFSPTGEWTFPGGTVFVKHFELPVNDADPTIRRRLETRLLVRDTNGTVYGATYKWRTDNGDAELVNNAVTEDILVTTPTGVRTQQWFFPGRQDCLRCHTVPALGVLGVKTRQQNGDFTYPSGGVTDNQLRAWNHIGLFNTALSEGSIPGYDKTVSATNATATLEHRFRSYIDANCSHCHRPNGVRAFFDARFDIALGNQGIINGVVSDNLGIAGARVVVPADTNKSVLLHRVNSVTDIKMPPLAKNVVDSDAVAMIAAWINSLPPDAGTLPPPWGNTDAGFVGIPGDASYSGGSFTLVGSGDDIWNNADAFHYVYQPLNGDGQITARVVAVQNTDPWAKAGVMIRETLAAGSAHAMMVVTPGNGTAFQRRTATDGFSEHTAGPAATAPYWVRLNRAGETLTGSVSDNGTAWTPVGSVDIAMSSQVYVGLAVTAHNNSMLNSSALDNVSVVTNSNAPPTVALTAPANGATFPAGTNITLAAAASDTDGTVAKVEFFRDLAKLGEDTSSPYSLVWSNVVAGSYSLTARATDSDGLASTSAVVNISVSAANAPPAVSITSPTNNASFVTPANIAINASASDTGGSVTKVEFFQGATKLGEDATSPFSLTWSNVAVGSYQLTARATDNGSLSSTSEVVSVTVAANSAPTVAIASPTNNARFKAGTNITINATASDSDGAVTRVEFFQGTSRLGEDLVGPYTLTWSNVAAGTYQLTARATDNSGATNTSTAVTLEVAPPLQLLSAEPATNGMFRLWIEGMDGVTYVVEATTNATTWIPVATNTPTTNLWLFVDPGASNFPWRFYRAREK